MKVLIPNSHNIHAVETDVYGTFPHYTVIKFMQIISSTGQVDLDIGEAIFSCLTRAHIIQVGGRH